ncbi:MAG TPA: chemotaxis protein CheR [Deltaproteobacteria bacterium]|jgi:chemotaxis protein methyltransferase CheR|nr:chemotaxis protein CheR [Deltaproteobacteria bacterium]
MSKPLTNQEFSALRDYIYKKAGIFFTEKNRFILEMRIEEILNETGYKSVTEYMRALEDYKTSFTEWNRLMNKVTITETSFFRDKYQITAIEKNVLPEIIKRREQNGSRQLRIWSAASSSGEEAYTMAILLAEQLKEAVGRWNIAIYATDINENALAAVRAGVYSSYSLRNTAEDIKRKYFNKLPDDRYEIKDHLKKMVLSEKCNLMDYNASRRYSKIDLILIRNVLIYFDQVSKAKVLQMCYENLNEKAFLFLGHSETIFGIANNFKLVSFVNAFAYMK